MSEISRFYDRRAGDADGEYQYPSHEFAEYFAKFLTNGVYTQGGEMGLKVTMSGLTATIGAGFAFVRGYMYAHEAPLKTLTLQKASTVAGLDRIDRIVLRLDVSARTITAELKTGTASSSPTAPSLTNSSGVVEIPMARVLVKANTSTGTVTDERVPVSSLIEIPYADMRAEFSQFIAEREGLSDTQLADMESEFDSWFNAIKSRIDDITELSLQADIDTNAAKITVLENDKMENSRIKLSTSDAVLSQMADGDIWIKYE